MVFYKACPVVADFPSPLFLSYHHHLPFPLQLLSSHGKLPRPGRSWYMILSALHYSLDQQKSLLIAIRRSSCSRFLAISLRTSTIHIVHSSLTPFDSETLTQYRTPKSSNNTYPNSQDLRPPTLNQPTRRTLPPKTSLTRQHSHKRLFVDILIPYSVIRAHW